MLFRVSYFRNRVNLEVSHIISDGRGAINLFKSLLHAYIAERYDVPGVPSDYDGSDSDKAEKQLRQILRERQGRCRARHEDLPAGRPHRPGRAHVHGISRQRQQRCLVQRISAE